MPSYPWPPAFESLLRINLVWETMKVQIQCHDNRDRSQNPSGVKANLDFTLQIKCLIEEEDINISFYSCGIRGFKLSTCSSTESSYIRRTVVSAETLLMGSNGI